MRGMGFWLHTEVKQRPPSYYMTAPGTGHLELRQVFSPEERSRPPAFPSGAGGLVATVDHFLAFARPLLNNDVGGGDRLLAAQSVEQMTRNHLSPEQIATAGSVLGGRVWGYDVAVVTLPESE